jgi:hypothetical protein
MKEGKERMMRRSREKGGEKKKLGRKSDKEKEEE